MSLRSLFAPALCLQDKTVIETVRVDSKDRIIVRVRPRNRDRNRCSRCQAKVPRYGRGSVNRRWRTLNVGCMHVYLESDTIRVECPEHGVVVGHVPWARSGARFSLAFDDLLSWLATQCSKTAVCEFTGVAWRSVGRAVHRVANATGKPLDRLTNLRRIGIDEIGYRKHHRYLTVVVDHDTGLLIWAAPGRSKAVVHQFFDALGEERCRRIEAVTRDAATWISTVVEERCPQAVQCMDPFHVIQWATQALDTARRRAVAALRYWDQDTSASVLKGTRYALLKNPENLTDQQKEQLRRLRKSRDPLHRAYDLKEALRAVFRSPPELAVAKLAAWVSWAQRCRIEPFVALAKKIRRQKEAIHQTLYLRLSNGRVEAVNTSIRLITRRAYGFHSADALIGLAMLSLGGMRPELPRPSSA